MTADTQTKPTDLGCESAARLLASTFTVAIFYNSSYENVLRVSADSGQREAVAWMVRQGCT